MRSRLLGLVLLASCQPPNGDTLAPAPERGPNDGPAPAQASPGQLVALPSRLSFGFVGPGVQIERQLSVANVGGRSVRARLSTEGSAAFSMSTSTVVIEPGRTTEVSLRFSAEAPGRHEATLRLRPEEGNALGIDLSGEVAPLDACGVSLAPEFLSFGVVERTRSLRRSVELTHRGWAPCVYELDIEPASEAYGWVTGEGEPRILAPGEVNVVTIEFRPRSGGRPEPFRSALVVRSAGREVARTTVEGSMGRSSQLLVVPQTLEYGTISDDAPARTVTVYNTGHAALELFSLEVEPSDAGFELKSEPPSAPLEAGDAWSFEVGPPRAGRGLYEARLRIVARQDGETTLYTVELRARVE